MNDLLWARKEVQLIDFHQRRLSYLFLMIRKSIEFSLLPISISLSFNRTPSLISKKQLNFILSKNLQDGSRGLGMSSLKPEDAVSDYSTLDETQLKTLNDWVSGISFSTQHFYLYLEGFQSSLFSQDSSSWSYQGLCSTLSNTILCLICLSFYFLSFFKFSKQVAFFTKVRSEVLSRLEV